MTIRFNPDLYSTVLAGLNINNRDQQQVLLELSSGKRVNVPSDDPAANATAMNIQLQQDQTDQFTQNISSVQGQLQMADSTMSSVITFLTQALTLGTQSGNSTLSASNRADISSQIQAVATQVMALANTSYQGAYIFAGTASNAPPYVANPASPNGVTYNGNTATNQVEIAQGEKININLPGSQIFTNGSADVFGALTTLAQAAQSGTGLSAAIGQLRTAFDHVSAQRAFYGSNLNQLDSTQNILAADKVQLSSQQNTVVGADIATAATQLSQVTTARSALLAAGGKIKATNLFDYLQ